MKKDFQQETMLINSYNKWVIKISPAVFLSCFLLLSGCLGEDTVSTGTINLDELPVSVPEPVLTVDAIDTMLFAFLYPYSTPLDDGSVLLADARRSQVYQLNRDGTGSLVADNGRGPGEVRFISNLTQGPVDYLYLFDSSNLRVSLFNRDLTYEREFVLKSPGEGVALEGVYPTAEKGLFIADGIDPRHFPVLDPDPVRVIGFYHQQEESYSNWIRVPDRRIAFTIINGEVQGFRQVPFMPKTHFSMCPDGGSFYLYWPPSEEIAELSLSMDTMRVIPVVLPEERFLESEKDSLLERWNYPDAATSRNMQSNFPEIKTPVDRFLVDDLGRFWLRLTRHSPAREWLVLDKEGVPQRIVQHSKELDVTHVSSQNIGIRSDMNMVFSFYEWDE